MIRVGFLEGFYKGLGFRVQGLGSTADFGLFFMVQGPGNGNRVAFHVSVTLVILIKALEAFFPALYVSLLGLLQEFHTGTTKIKAVEGLILEQKVFVVVQGFIFKGVPWGSMKSGIESEYHSLTAPISLRPSVQKACLGCSGTSRKRNYLVNCFAYDGMLYNTIESYTIV